MNRSFFDKDPIKKRLLPEFSGLTVRRQIPGRTVQISKDSISNSSIENSDNENSQNYSNIEDNSIDSANSTSINGTQDSSLGVSSFIDSDTSYNIYGEGSNEEYSIAHRLHCEFNLLCRNVVNGVFVLPAEESHNIWHGVIFLRHGVYSGAIFRFQIKITNDFVDGVTPRIIFSKPGIPFHPLIDPITGELNVSIEFPVWRYKKDKLFHLVQYVRRIFYKIDIHNARNLEAARCYTDDGRLLMIKVKESIQLSNNNVFQNNENNDNHSIKFNKMNEEEYCKAQLLIAETIKEFDRKKLKSWMRNDFSSKLDNFEKILKSGNDSRNSITEVLRY